MKTLLPILFGVCLLMSSAVNANKNPLNIQLASHYQNDTDIRQYWVSEKLDGIRGYWNGKQMLTRSGHRIRLPPFFTDNWPPVPLEGELWIGRGQFQTIASIVKKHHASDQEWQQVKFMLFDMPDHPGTFSERITAMKTVISQTNNRHLQLIAQYRVNDNDQLSAWLDATVIAGGEGLMLHHAKSYYQQGRTSKVMKLKPFFDDEAKVIAHLPGKGKYLHKLGAIKVENSAGQVFKIGSGFSDNERENPPPIGSIITYKYSGKTNKGVPRFATYLRIR